MRVTPSNELYNRIERLQQQMMENDIDGAIIVQNADLYYFTGTAQRAHLYVPSVGAPLLAVSKSYERSLEESALDEIVPLESPKKLPELLRARGLKPGARLGFELDVLPAGAYLRYQKIFAEQELMDISPQIRRVRMIKSAYELEILKDAGALCARTYQQIGAMIREGMSEIELAGQVEAAFRRGGHQGFVRMRSFNQELFFGHLMSGSNANVPSNFDSPTGGRGMNPSFPQSAGTKLVKRHEPVLIDYVGVVDGYIVDQTRIFALGNLPDKLLLAHETALAVQDRVTREARPGAVCADLYDMALALVEERGLLDNFMGYKNPLAFVGHGVGIELDEWPVLARGFKMKLEANMVFALEPKFHFPGEGVVGIENTFVVGEDGCARLTTFPDHIVRI